MLRLCWQRIFVRFHFSQPQIGCRSFRSSSLRVKKMADVELLNLSEDNEHVRIGNKFYRLNATNDEITFENLPSNEFSNAEKIVCAPLKIKCSEVLFVRKHYLNEGHRLCCNSEHRYTIVNHKHLKYLITKETESLVTKSTSATSEVTKRDVPDTNREPSSSHLGIYHILRISKFRWRIALLVCCFETETLCEKWEQYLRSLRQSFNRPKRLLIFVNPYGGKKRAAQVYKFYVEAVLKLCDIGVTVITTQRANHARDYLKERDLREYDGILSVGGDGLFNEIMNGLLAITQTDSKIDINDRNAALIAPRLKLAAIPAGSTNALAFTIHGTDDPLTAVLHVAVGDSRSVDVCSIHCGAEFHRFACTASSYGFLGDVLKDSERLRMLGPTRYLVSGLKLAARHPWYKGKIEMKLAMNDNHDESKANEIHSELPLQRCHSKCDLCGDKKGSNSNESSDCTMDQEFMHLVGIITPCLSKLSPCGLSPTCHLGDGSMHLAIVSRISRYENFKFITRVMSKRADHLSLPFVKLRKITEFSFTPRDASINNNVTTKSEFDSRVGQNGKDLGSWNIDGELLTQPNGTIYFKMHRQLMSLFARGIEMDEIEQVKRSPMKLQSCACCFP